MQKNNQAKKVLIFTAEAGGGHVSLAHAMEDTIQDHDKKIATKIVNTIPKSAELLYRYIGNRFAGLYTSLWEFTNIPQNTEFLIELATNLAYDTIEKEILKYNPSLIITTEPIAIRATQKVLQANKLDIPHLIYVADPYTIHHAWATRPYATTYLSATKIATAELVKMGIPQKRIATVGFLLRKPYYALPHNNKYHKKINLFIGGSGSGGGDILQLVKYLSKDEAMCKDASLTIACGKNNILKSQLKLLPQLKNIRHEILGYTPNIYKYLAVCDMVIGKPGPNLLFESVMYKKPFIATSDPLAQEIGNYEFIDQAHIGFSTTNTRIALSKIKNLLKNKDQFSDSIEKVRKQHVAAPKKVWQELTKYL